MAELKVTDVQIYPATKSGKIQAYVTVVFSDVLATKGWKIIDGAKGPWLATPSQMGKDGKFYDTLYIPGAQKDGSNGSKFSKYVEGAVLKKYGETQAEKHGMDQTSGDDEEIPF